MAFSYGQPLTPAEDRYRQLAEAMIARGLNPGITMGGWGGVGQGIDALAQALTGSIMSRRAETERQQATDKAFEALGKSGLDPKYLELARALGPDQGLDLATRMLTTPENTDLVEVVENGRKVWKRKSEAAGLQSDFPKPDEAPKTVGGMMWDEGSNSYISIPGYTEQAAAIAAAGRQPRQPTEMETWEAWLKSDDPLKRQAAEIHFKVGSGTGASGPYEGTGMEQQDMNVLLDPNADTASPLYQQAYTRQYQTPKYQSAQVQQEDGTVQTVLVPVMPIVPQGIRQPGTPSQPQATATPQDQLQVQPQVQAQPQATVQAQQQPTAGQPIIVGQKPYVPNEFQGASAGYASRMTAAEPIIQQFEAAASSGWQNLLNRVPGGNYLQSSEYQQVRQAQEDWVRAKLRKESGAVIGEQEMAKEIEQYFPQPGDGAAVITQKRRARQTALEAMKQQAGPAAKQGQKIQRWDWNDKGELVPVQ